MADLFSSSRYPSVEETLGHNAQQLYKQKRHFLADLRTLVATLGYSLMGILYVRDCSAIIFCLRAFAQLGLAHPFATHFQHIAVLGEHARAEQRWFFLWTVFVVNAFSFLDHVFLGTYRSSKAADGQLHGGMSLQFIGERLAFSRWELVLYDFLLLFVQLLHFCLMCTTDDLAVLHATLGGVGSIDCADGVDCTVSLDMVSDGFDGNVNLLTLDIWSSVKGLWRHQRPPLTPEDAQAMQSFRERALRRMLA